MLAIIGGSGFELEGFVQSENLEIETPFGSACMQNGLLDAVPLLVLPRHGNPPGFPPHRINYRANIWALAEQRVDKIIAINAVGSVNPDLQPAELVFADQIVDYTYGRAHTYFENEICHIDFTFPYDPGLRNHLLEAAEKTSRGNAFLYRHQGVYGCTQGPRLETAAEIRRLARDGCDVVGMTAMPEAALAREKEIPYAAISVVVNKGAGMDDQPIDLGAIEKVMVRGMGFANRVIRQFVTSIG